MVDLPLQLNLIHHGNGQGGAAPPGSFPRGLLGGCARGGLVLLGRSGDGDGGGFPIPDGGLIRLGFCYCPEALLEFQIVLQGQGRHIFEVLQDRGFRSQGGSQGGPLGRGAPKGGSSGKGRSFPGEEQEVFYFPFRLLLPQAVGDVIPHRREGGKESQKAAASQGQGDAPQGGGKPDFPGEGL